MGWLIDLLDELDARDGVAPVVSVLDEEARPCWQFVLSGAATGVAAVAIAVSLMGGAGTASADPSPGEVVVVEEVAPVFTAQSVLAPCAAGEERLGVALRRVSTGDHLAADEAAIVAEFLMEQCGWLEAQTIEGRR